MTQSQATSNSITMEEIAEWWNSLSEEQRFDYLLQLNQKVGFTRWNNMSRETQNVVFNAYRRWSATCE